MFIADCLVGNFDRHNGNWGFLINESLKKIGIAPIYDCASCLYPQINIQKIYSIIDETPFISEIRKEFYKRVINMRYEKILKYSYEKMKGI